MPGTLPDVSWFNAAGGAVEWGTGDLSLTCLLAAPPTANSDEPPRHVLLMCHAGTLPREFSVPLPARRIKWSLFVNTAADSPADVYPNLDGPELKPDAKLTLLDHSLLCYVSTR